MRDGMIVTVVDLEGRPRAKRLKNSAVICAALKELLLSHDGLYRQVFPGPPANPSWDIAAKNARRIYKALKQTGKMPETLTLEEEFL